jgi:hypothetical protein
MSDTEYSRQQPSPGGAPPVTAATIIESLAPIEQSEMARARGIAAKLSPEVADTLNAINGHLHAAASISGKAAAEIQRLRADDMSNPEGVKARIAELEKKAPQDVDRAYDAALAVADSILGAQLLTGALPTIAPEERAAAVDEVKLLLEAHAGENLIRVMQQLAAGSDRRLAAVVVSSWGRARLGGDDALHNAIRLGAIEGSKKFGTPSERAHAEAFGSNGTLTVAARKAISVSRARARHRLGGDF